jgi:hypothetical protein
MSAFSIQLKSRPLIPTFPSTGVGAAFALRCARTGFAGGGRLRRTARGRAALVVGVGTPTAEPEPRRGYWPISILGSLLVGFLLWGRRQLGQVTFCGRVVCGRGCDRGYPAARRSGAMTEVRHRSIETNGIRMHLAEQGAGPLVLLCHGFPESWYS